MAGMSRSSRWKGAPRGFHLAACELVLAPFTIGHHLTTCTNRELSNVSKITVIIKAGHTIAKVPIRKREGLAEISVQEAIEAFWNSQGSISCTLESHGCPVL